MLISFAPVGIMAIFFLTIILNYIIPEPTQNLFESIVTWCIGIGILPLAFFGFLLVNVIYKGVPFRQLFKPQEEWGPTLNKHRGESTRYALLKQERWGKLKSKPNPRSDSF